MKQIFIKILMLAGVITPLSSYSASRINGNIDNRMRCLDTALPAEDCEYRRKQALEIGCITPEEYNDLVRFGSAPSCNTLKKVQSPLQYLEGWCSCGCFAPFTRVAVADNGTSSDYINQLLFVSSKRIASNKNNFNLVHLTEEATLSDLQTTSSPIRISTEGVEDKELVQIITEDYRKLFVTPKHPILSSKGEMLMAQDLRPGDQLMDRNSTPIGIKSLSTIPYRGKVYNFMSESESYNGHVIFAEDLAVGDLYWQSSLEDQYNQEFIRK